jgi:Na+-transporting NADH:ubiquinone oxidoreductase subunit NqrA
MGHAGISVKKGMDQTIDFRQKLLEMWDRLKDSVPAVLVMLDNAEGLKQNLKMEPRDCTGLAQIININKKNNPVKISVKQRFRMDEVVKNE